MPPTATAATDEASMAAAVTATTAVRGGKTSSEQIPGAVGAGGRACVFQPLSARARRLRPVQVLVF